MQVTRAWGWHGPLSHRCTVPAPGSCVFSLKASLLLIPTAVKCPRLRDFWSFSPRQHARWPPSAYPGASWFRVLLTERGTGSAARTRAGSAAAHPQPQSQGREQVPPLLTGTVILSIVGSNAKAGGGSSQGAHHGLACVVLRCAGAGRSGPSCCTPLDLASLLGRPGGCLAQLLPGPQGADQ